MQQCTRHCNAVVGHTFLITAILEESNLFFKSLGIRGKKKLAEELTLTFEQYNGFLENLSKSKTLFTELEEIEENVRQIQEDIISSREKMATIQENAGQFLAQIETHENQSDAHSKAVVSILEGAQTLVNSIQKYEVEAEEKRLGIETFSRNIDEYKNRISSLESRAKAIVEKEKTISELIRSAEQALNLKSAEGISAAFASQYEKASCRKIAIFWLSASSLFVIAAIGITIWLVLGDCNIESNFGISAIIARIVAVAITVTAATFCAKQYVKQKNIAEDHAYKAVLSKSIIAFTDKLKEKSGDNSNIVAEYLQQVLAEIHQDPLRQRNAKEEQIPDVVTDDLLLKIIETIRKHS